MKDHRIDSQHSLRAITYCALSYTNSISTSVGQLHYNKILSIVMAALATTMAAANVLLKILYYICFSAINNRITEIHGKTLRLPSVAVILCDE